MSPKQRKVSDTDLLEAVERHTEGWIGASASDVADELGISRSWSSTLLRRLEEAGKLEQCTTMKSNGRPHWNGYRRIDE